MNANDESIEGVPGYGTLNPIMNDQNQLSGQSPANEHNMSFRASPLDPFSAQPYINQGNLSGHYSGLMESALRYSQEKLLLAFQRNPEVFDQVKEILSLTRDIHTLLVQTRDGKMPTPTLSLGEKSLLESPSNIQKSSGDLDIEKLSDCKERTK